MELLFPVVPDVLDIVIFFHDVDELFHSKPSVSLGECLIYGKNTTIFVCRITLIVNKCRNSEPTFSLAQ
jgi:hypothetical protein